jgi:phosphopantothenoylcysteine decarboxylase/phosphopantothenate--cysteine ligase
MEQHMYQHPATQANLRVLADRGAVIMPPDTGHLASGEVGVGRLPETGTIVAAIQALLGQHGDLAGRRVVVTAGGTAEPIDPVRYIGNRSSGRMGFALAEEARNRGAEVTLIVGTVAVAPPEGIAIQQAATALAMRDAVVTATADADVLVMAAAVADYRIGQPAKEKIKKGSSAENPDGSLTLHLVRNPDILAELAGTTSSGTLIRVGFAAETTDLHQHAVQKLRSKGLDLLIANDVSKEGSGFGTITDEVVIYSRDGSAEPLPLLPKAQVAEAIWDRVVKLLPDRSQLPASRQNRSSETR